MSEKEREEDCTAVQHYFELFVAMLTQSIIVLEFAWKILESRLYLQVEKAELFKSVDWETSDI